MRNLTLAVLAAFAIVVITSASARAVTIPGRTGTASPSSTGATGTTAAPVVVVTGGGAAPTMAPPGN